MKFRVGNKVKVTKEFLSQLSNPTTVKALQGIGTITGWAGTGNCSHYFRIKFINGTHHYLYGSNLELTPIKNQQLIFSFME